MDAAQEAYDAVKDRANLAHESIDPTDNLQFEAEYARLQARNTGDRQKSEKSRGEYQKAKDAAKKAMDEKAESDRAAGYAGRELDKAQSACDKIVRNR